MPDISKMLGTAGGMASMVPGIGTAIGAGLSVASTIFGAIKGAKANKANEQALNKQYEENAAFYGNNAKRDYLQTNAAQSVVQQYKQNLLNNQKNIAGRGAITGASDEALVASNTGAQQNYNNAIANVAGQGVNYQLGNERMFRANLDQLNQRRMMINQQKADNAANLVGNAGDLFNTMAFASAMKNRVPTDGGLGETAAKLDTPTAAITPTATTPTFSGYLVDQQNNQPDANNYKSRQGNY